MKFLLPILLFIILISCSRKELKQLQYFDSGDYELVFENDPNGITFFFTGVDYEVEDFEKNKGQYRLDGIRIINEIFTTPPFSEYKEFFNVYIVYVKHQSGIDGFETAPETIVRSLELGFNKEKDIILISVDKPTIGGTAGDGTVDFGYNDKSVMMHEIGHLAGNLSDEYFWQKFETAYCDNTLSPNTDTINDLNEIKWKHFIGLPGYEDVGAYLGACGTGKNIWRPTSNSFMGISGTKYNAPSREAIVKKIMKIKGLPYNFEEFLAKDVTD